MKIIITRSLGNISKPLAKELVQKGHVGTVISSNPDKQKDKGCLRFARYKRCIYLE